MKKLLFTLFVLITLIGVTYSTTSRNYTHKDKAINQEFDNVYYQMSLSQPIPQRTSTQLIAVVPGQIGLMYLNTTTNELWISTGTLINQFVHK